MIISYFSAIALKCTITHQITTGTMADATGQSKSPCPSCGKPYKFLSMHFSKSPHCATLAMEKRVKNTSPTGQVCPSCNCAFTEFNMHLSKSPSCSAEILTKAKTKVTPVNIVNPYAASKVGMYHSTAQRLYRPVLTISFYR